MFATELFGMEEKEGGLCKRSLRPCGRAFGGVGGHVAVR